MCSLYDRLLSFTVAQARRVTSCLFGGTVRHSIEQPLPHFAAFEQLSVCCNLSTTHTITQQRCHAYVYACKTLRAPQLAVIRVVTWFFVSYRGSNGSLAADYYDASCLHPGLLRKVLATHIGAHAMLFRWLTQASVTFRSLASLVWHKTRRVAGDGSVATRRTAAPRRLSQHTCPL